MRYLTNLEGKRVVFTGQLVVDGAKVRRRDAINLARRHGASASSNLKAKVTSNVDVLVRGASPHHAYGDWGEDEEAAARLQREGHRIVIIDGEGFGAALAGGWAPILQPRSHGPRLRSGCRHYRPANTSVDGEAELPAVRDMTTAIRAHHRLQERIAEAARDAGHLVVSWSRSDAAFDVGWIDASSRLHVVEVKSLEGANQAAQLRLGIGQLLDYWARLEPDGAYLAVARVPKELGHWRRICEEVGLELLMPSDLDDLFA